MRLSHVRGAALVLLALPPALLAQAPPAEWSARDRGIFEEKLRWARSAQLDTLPLGDAIAAMGLTFVGTPYEAASLEKPGPERLVVNLHGLDCVTFVETVLALSWLVRNDGALLGDATAARARYEDYLRQLRYRDGRIDGYASRLHYFTEWLAQGTRRNRWHLVTGELGGVPTWQEINFMTTHQQAYPAMADPATVMRIADVEEQLSAMGPVSVLPKGWIDGSVSDRLQTGDIVAATSARAGLDVVHTGFAVRKDGITYLLHAPLAGGNVELSARPLAERLQRLRGQSGVIIARPIGPS
jgi:hypothetical protein